jgi:hypothetical protein
MEKVIPGLVGDCAGLKAIVGAGSARFLPVQSAFTLYHTIRPHRHFPNIAEPVTPVQEMPSQPGALPFQNNPLFH